MANILASSDTAPLNSVILCYTTVNALSISAGAGSRKVTDLFLFVFGGSGSLVLAATSWCI
jgi:hypothetical protein